MIQIGFRTKKNGMPVLSKDEIDCLAERVIGDYNRRLLDEPGRLDVEHFLEFYAELEMDYQNLTHNQSILGMTVFNDCYIPVYDAENNRAKRIPVKEGTILIDSSLLNDGQLRRGRFTLGHEISHWFLHRHMYMVDRRQLSLFEMDEKRQAALKCRSADIEYSGRKKLVSDEEWMEWQADYMASALLMPKRPFCKIAREEFESAKISEGFYEIGTNFERDFWAEALSYELADIFDVSLRAARIRLRTMGFIRESRDSGMVCLG